jgi:hypothetical protein
MAAGDVLLDDDGNVILDDDGNVVLDDGAGNPCCCVPACPACAPAATPRILRVTFAGTGHCGCVLVVSGGGGRVTASHTAGTFDGTYDFERWTLADGPAWYTDDRGRAFVSTYGCAWVYRDPASTVTATQYTDPFGSNDCDAGDVNASTSDLRMFMETNGALQAYQVLNGDTAVYFDAAATGWCPDPFPQVFTGDDCAVRLSLNVYHLRGGGTATVQAIY